MGMNEAKRALEIRALLSKSSTKKYISLLERACRERVRDISLYHGAHTGRESGTGLQLQNLPRGTFKDTDRVIEDILKGDRAWLNALYGEENLMNLFSSVIRGMITATPGFKLYSADYNAIEARVVAWLAGEESALEVFRKGLDPYVRMAARIFNKKMEDVTPEERQLGKVAVLGLGFGMGAAKFEATCQNFRLTIDPELASKAVKAYRALHPKVVRFWYGCENSAIKAVKNTGRKVKQGLLEWESNGVTLWCRLPSGRRLYYQRPSVKVEATPWGEPANKLYYYSVDSLTKKWVNSSSYGGLLTENVVQATARDVMISAMIRVDRAGYDVLFGVHDEIVSEHKNGDLKQYEALLSELPPWGKGLPVVAKGWKGSRYRKG